MKLWTNGRILDESEFRISPLDRTFEHGLGLFETLRTWFGFAPLLDLHLERLTASAQTLGLPLDTPLPDHRAVTDLLAANAIDGDARLRITLTGGLSATQGATLWMTARPLGDQPETPLRLGFFETVGPTTTLDHHKTLNYWRRRRAHEAATAAGFDDALIATPDGHVWEASRSNLFVVLADRTLATPGPPESGPFLTGIFRQCVVPLARGDGTRLVERPIHRDELLDPRATSELFLTNSVRGIQPVAYLDGRVFPARGPVTSAIRRRVLHSITMDYRPRRSQDD